MDLIKLKSRSDLHIFIFFCTAISHYQSPVLQILIGLHLTQTHLSLFRGKHERVSENVLQKEKQHVFSTDRVLNYWWPSFPFPAVIPVMIYLYDALPNASF